MTPRVLCLLALCCGGAASAQEEPPACGEVATIPLPAADQPQPADRQRLAGCDSESLYYGAARDDRDARLCAYLEREDGNQVVIGGSAVLMMLYANGRGVERDYALAQRFACEAGGAPAELDGRIAHLQELARAGGAVDPLDLCDDVTSGYMMGFCAERDAGLRRVGREREWRDLMQPWSEADRRAWAVLLAAAEVFFDRRIEAEVDVSGTARGAMIVGETQALQEDLLASVAAFERGELPQADAAELRAIDAALNAAYREARAAAQPEAPGDTYTALGTITADGIRDTQRAWLRYRDAWPVFGRQRYPQVASEAWLAYFTRKREAQLRELAQGL